MNQLNTGVDRKTLAKAVHKLFNTESTEERAMIQQQLGELAEKDDLNHAETIVNLLLDSEDQEIKDVKMSLAVYCKQLYKLIVQAGYNNVQRVDIERTLRHIELLFMCFESKEIELKQKAFIFDALQPMVLLYKYQENMGEGYFKNITDIANKIKQQAVNGLQAEDTDMLKSSFMLTDAMFSLGEDKSLKIIQEVCVTQLYIVVEQQMGALNNHILQLNNMLKQDQLQLTRENEVVDQIMKKIDIVVSFIKMIFRVFEKTTSKGVYHKCYYDFVKSPTLSSILVRVFGINIQIPNSPNNNSVIQITGLQVLDNVINQLKTKSLECINLMLKKKDNTCEALIKTNEHQVINGQMNLVPILIQSLILLGQRSDLEQLLEEDTISNFVVEALENLSVTTQYEAFKDVFFKFLPNLILDVAMNFIKTTETERQQMYDEPVEFVNLALDTCDKQQSYVVKTQAAKLFEGLCDNIDGAVTMSSYFCIQSLNMTISKETGKEPLNFDTIAANIEQGHRDLIEKCAFIKHSKQDVIIESIIVVIGLLSYLNSKAAYANIFQAIEKVFSYYHQEILNNDSKLIKVRYSLFLGYLIDVLYKDDPACFVNTILFLYNSVNLTGENKAIALQSIDTLKTVTCDHDLIPRFQSQNILPQLVSLVQQSILTIQNEEYLDFVQDFLVTFSTVIDDQIMGIAQAVIQRIQNDLPKGASGSGSGLFTQKCINILKQITQNKKLMEKYSSEYEEAYKPIFEYMIDPTKISFEDDILIILKNFIRKTNRVSDIMYTVFPTLEKVFDKNKHCFGEALMDTLNYYMIYGKEQLVNDQAAIQMLLNIASKGMETTQPNITVNNSQGAIFLQIIFQVFQGTQCLNPFAEIILDKVLQRLKGPNQAPAKSTLQKHLLQVFLAALYYDANGTMKYMVDRDIYKQVLTEIINLKKSFQNPYECKIFIVGITQVLVIFDAPEMIKKSQTISRLLQEILIMLDKVKKKEARKALNKGSRAIQADEGEDDDDSYGDDDTESDDYYDEEIDEPQPGTSKRSRSNSGNNRDMQLDGEEETKTTETPMGLGFTTDEVEKPADDDNDEDDSEYDNQFELQIILDQVKTPVLKDIDEFSMFSKAVNQMANQRPHEIGGILAELTPEQNAQLKELLLTKRISVTNGDTVEARKIIKPKRRGQ